jgi:hypothetical protein
MSKNFAYWCCRDKNRLSTEQDFIVEIEGFDRFMLVLNDKLKHPSLIDLDNVENSVLVKNVIQQVKNYKEQLTFPHFQQHIQLFYRLLSEGQ